MLTGIPHSSASEKVWVPAFVFT